ncbi:uncharacterized protein [Nicotiana tomentosiformis]|uniref:uncharacterized protein n=1 Tax=Nicotiana tomentosiformis TaxID=4098 RepID=UPI00388C96E3
MPNERSRQVGAAPLLWNKFSVLFLEKFVPQTLREELRRQFEHLCQEDLSMTQYEMRFSKLAHHAVWLVPTEREKIRRLINGLNQQFRFVMTLGNVGGAKFDEVVDRARRLEMVHIQECEERKDKRSRDRDIGDARVTKDEWRGSPNFVPSRVISYLKAKRMVEKGCLSYLDFVRDFDIGTPTIDSVPVVREFPDVFPANLSGMPTNRDIDYIINFVLGTLLISIPPHHMVPAELKELK